MCLFIAGVGLAPHYSLVIIANRDELYSRPTRAAAWWDTDPPLLGGRDLEAGGTWLAMTAAGRWAAATNVRAPGARVGGKRSRGLLITDFLAGNETPTTFLDTLVATRARYNGYNFICGDTRETFCYSNWDNRAHRLDPGLHAVSNHLLDTPWPKVTRAKQAVAALIEQHTALDPDMFIPTMHDTSPADDASLPDTGLDLARERALSPIFTRTEHYGTRNTTVILFGVDGTVRFLERSYRSNGATTDTRRFEFHLRT